MGCFSSGPFASPTFSLPALAWLRGGIVLNGSTWQVRGRRPAIRAIVLGISRRKTLSCLGRPLDFYVFFTQRLSPVHISLTCIGATNYGRTRICGASCMFDILIIFLGGGGILLMAAYAALCERI